MKKLTEKRAIYEGTERCVDCLHFKTRIVNAKAMRDIFSRIDPEIRHSARLSKKIKKEGEVRIFRCAKGRGRAFYTDNPFVHRMMIQDESKGMKPVLCPNYEYI
jgi:hypothetical protein